MTAFTSHLAREFLMTAHPSSRQHVSLSQPTALHMYGSSAGGQCGLHTRRYSGITSRHLSPTHSTRVRTVIGGFVVVDQVSLPLRLVVSMRVGRG